MSWPPLMRPGFTVFLGWGGDKDKDKDVFLLGWGGEGGLHLLRGSESARTHGTEVGLGSSDLIWYFGKHCSWSFPWFIVGIFRSKLILRKTLCMIIPKSVSLEISPQTLRCSDGQWSGEVPTCEQVRNQINSRALCGYFLAGTFVMKAKIESW